MTTREYQKKYASREETRDEKIERYMKSTKKDVVIMLVTAQDCLNQITNKK